MFVRYLISTIPLLLTLFLFSCDKTSQVSPIKGEILEAVYGLGTVQSDHVFHSKAAIVTYVEQFFVQEGEDVNKGDKLYMLDGGFIMRSPFSGRVTAIPVTVRENIFPQTIILTVVDLKNIFLSVSLDQEATLKIKKGMKAEATFEFFRNNKLLGTVESLYSQEDHFIAKVRFPNWPDGILAGMTADVVFEIARKTNAILIPTKAISNGYITIKRDNKKSKIKVVIGLKDDEKVEIISPSLDTNDLVIIP